MWRVRKPMAWRISQELWCPTSSVLGRITAFVHLWYCAGHSKAAARLLNVQPDETVMQIGVGLGHALQVLFEKVENGRGFLFGVDSSDYLLQKAKRTFALEIEAKRMTFCRGFGWQLPALDNSVDCVFHSDAFWYFPLGPSLHEIRRVLKPGGRMLTAFSLSWLNLLKRQNLLQHCHCTDPLDYMIALEKLGFDDVRFEYHDAARSPFQTISSIKAAETASSSLVVEKEAFLKAVLYEESVKQSLKSQMPMKKVPDVKALMNLGCKEIGFFITTPIFYANAAPHIGHLYSSVIADAAARWFRLRNFGRKTLFSSGTDEHGAKVAEAALLANMSPRSYCDIISGKYKDLHDMFSIETDRFIRTTEERHKTAVHHFWNTLKTKGYIYSGEYSGWYCYQDECFYSPSDVCDGQGGKISKISGRPVVWQTETNYMFRLKSLLPEVRKWLETYSIIKPEKYRSMVLDQLGSHEDMSISRCANRQPWGIEVPGDPSQTVYVWLDALVNYLTVANYPDTLIRWPPECHVIGKDILKFHAIFWPALLLACDLPLPKKIFCHAHWMVDGLKMSKSLKNVIDPVNEARLLTTDGLRYVLLRQGVPHSDGNYSTRLAVEILNDELANGIGNLLNRVTSRAVLSKPVFPDFSEALLDDCFACCPELLDEMRTLPGIVAEHFDRMEFWRGIQAIGGVIRGANRFVQANAPWTLAKEPAMRAKLDTVLHFALTALRLSGVLLLPVVPGMAARILDKLGVHPEHRHYASLEQSAPASNSGRLNLESQEQVFHRIRW